MPKYKIFMQLPPEEIPSNQKEKLYTAKIRFVQETLAETAAEAIKFAKKLPLFRIAKNLARFPLVQEMRS